MWQASDRGGCQGRTVSRQFQWPDLVENRALAINQRIGLTIRRISGEVAKQATQQGHHLDLNADPL